MNNIRLTSHIISSDTHSGNGCIFLLFFKEGVIMRFCSYGRKSVFSDKSDSIDNQFRMSRDYVEARFYNQIESWVQYSDEDFTGANTNRPDLNRMLDDIKDGLYDALVVYQLDRLSRDVRDFANIYAMLEEHHVMFISIKESIDTTTPIGRAMMYVTVVFAQMERETIAARVRDNMQGLAKKGYWTGGNPPVGYVRKRIIVDGKKHVTIEPDPDGVKYVHWIFDTFLEYNCSLQSMETRFKNQGIKTLNGKFFSTNQLHKILTMPLCVEATPEVYDYYAEKGCIMDSDSPREKWDGSVGVIIYGRTTEINKKHQLQPPEKWIVCLGLHKPFMPAEKWLAVQARFTHNKFTKDTKLPIPLLKGTLRCKCGTLMRVARKKRVDGSRLSSYYCAKRMRKGLDACDMGHTKCEILDEKVLSVFREITIDPSAIQKYVKKESISEVPDLKSISTKISSCEKKIGRLAASLAMASESSASKYIIAEMERLDAELSALKKEAAMAEVESRKHAKFERDADADAREIAKFIHGLDGFDDKERNEIVRSVVKECVWDGSELFLTL